MQGKPANKHKAKSEATRIALLNSAEKIFFRDGFERAQIDAIAADAGRTRGAIYAQFKSKEQLFLALLERRMEEIEDLGREFLRKENVTDSKERLKAFRKFYIMLYRPDWAILDLEFKLYGLRHPEMREKLKEMTEKVWDESLHAALYEAKRYRGQSKIESRMASLTPLASAIVLAMHWQPDVMTLEQARLVLGEVFDGIFSDAEAAEEDGAVASGTRKVTAKRTKRG